LQVNGWNGDYYLKRSEPVLEGKKSHVLPYMWIVDLKQIQQNYRTQVIILTVQGKDMAREGNQKFE
jgi:hypothetical protein